MPGNKKPKKKYRPRPIYAPDLQYMAVGLQRLADVEDRLLILKTKHHGALVQLVNGLATDDDMEELVGAVNMAESLALLGKGKPWLKEIRAGQDAVFNVLERSPRICSQAEKDAILLLVDIHDAQLEVATILDIERALALIQRRILAGQVRGITLELPHGTEQGNKDSPEPRAAGRGGEA